MAILPGFRRDRRWRLSRRLHSPWRREKSANRFCRSLVITSLNWRISKTSSHTIRWRTTSYVSSMQGESERESLTRSWILSWRHCLREPTARQYWTRRQPSWLPRIATWSIWYRNTTTDWCSMRSATAWFGKRLRKTKRLWLLILPRTRRNTSGSSHVSRASLTM